MENEMIERVFTEAEKRDIETKVLILEQMMQISEAEFLKQKEYINKWLTFDFKKKELEESAKLEDMEIKLNEMKFKYTSMKNYFDKGLIKVSKSKQDLIDKIKKGEKIDGTGNNTTKEENNNISEASKGEVTK